MVMLPPPAQLSSFVDLLGFGVVFIDEVGDVRRVNDAAQEMLDRHDGLLVRDSRLAAISDEASVRLERLVAEVRCGSAGEGATVERPSGWLPYQVIGYPLHGGGVLLVSDPARDICRFDRCIRALHGFTPAESEVVTELARGLDLKQIAAVRGVSRETIRTLLKRAYEKTGTRRQIDLVRLVMGCIVTLEPCGHRSDAAAHAE